MAKILICIPSGDLVASGFAQSLAMLQKGGNETAIMFQVGSLIYDARNKLAKQAIKMGADYTMWFDSDMIFKPDTMLRLLEHKWTDLELPDKPVKCGGVGFGCVLVKTEVLFEVAAKFRTWFEPMNGFGEDLSFCYRARECGYDILLDPTIMCGHVGHIVVNEDFYKAYSGGAK